MQNECPCFLSGKYNMDASAKHMIGKQGPSCTVVMPAYNAAAYIGEAIDSVLQQTRTDWRLLVIDDGSTDGTTQLADDLCADHSSVRVIHHPLNRGYGGALQTGFLESSKDLVFYTDADCQFDLQ